VGCESAACWPVALIEANRVAVNIAFQVHMTLLSIFQAEALET
jgi:hypothetical protein